MRRPDSILATSFAAFLAGLPAYLALDALRVLPAPLREQPWPLEVGCAALAVLTFVLALRRPGRRAPIAAAVCTAVAAASAVALPVGANMLPRLPPAPADFPSGQLAPDFELPDQDGRPVRLSALRGQPVLLVVFLGSWCPYCRAQMTALAAEARAAGPDAPKILALSSDPPEALAQMRRELDIPFALLSDPDQTAVPVCATSRHCLVALDGTGALRWGGNNENWRTPPPYREVLRGVARWR